MKTIIDVSEFNGLIDWSKISGNVDGAILRAGYRGYGQTGTMMRDKQIDRNLAECRKRGIPWGVYFLTQATTQTEAQAEADFVQGIIGGETAPLGVWLDSEFGDAQFAGGRADRLRKDQRTMMAVYFLRRLQEYGQKTGLYCAADWYHSMISGEAIRGDGHLVWLASVENVRPELPWDGWQYTWKGKIDGIHGDVDISHFVERIGGNTVGKHFEDTKDHWAAEEIDRMKERGLINGKTDELFCPNDLITRAEVAVIIDRLCQKLGI